MANVMREYLEIVRFFYGLIFFALGFAIVLQPRRNSVYYLSHALTWLAGFALIHAVADWGLIFIPLRQGGPGGSALIQQLLTFRTLGVIVSFGLLMQFGIMLLVEHHPYRRVLSLLPSLVTAAFVLLLLFREFSPQADLPGLTDVRIAARYFLGFPAALLSAWGLIRQVPVLRKDQSRYVRYLTGAAVCFVLYGILAGLVVSEREFFPANMINETTFFAVFRQPVEVGRALAMLGVTVCIIELLDIFHQETQRRLRLAEQDRALLREREQIGRDLHDGIMQTLYGTGLGVKQVLIMAETQPDQAKEILSELNAEIGRAIVQMRRYVLDLKEQTISATELVDDVRALAQEISQFAGISVKVTTEGADQEIKVPCGLREDALAIVRQGLSNVVRHADAREATVTCALDEDTLLLRVSDPGRGFDPAGESGGGGIESLRERVEAVGGLLQVMSAEGEGTHLVAHLPVWAKRSAARPKEGKA